MERVQQGAPRAWVVAAVSCVALVGLAYFFADRPIAVLAHDRLHGIAPLVWLTYIPELLVPLTGLVLLGLVAATALGRSPGPIGMVLVRCSVSLLVAMAVKDQLKYAFGRTWPETWTGNNPSFIGNGVFGFVPFHGGAGWAAFPSGHTTAICAVVSVLWVAWPRFRWLYPIPVALVVIGLLGADFHWLSDTIAGAYLGTAAGVTTALAGKPRTG